MRLSTGSRYEYPFRFEQSDVIEFAKVTGDNNPIHLDSTYAAKTLFKKPIVHGFLAGSVFSKVFGTLFPGEGTIYLHQDMSFRRPMFVGEEFVARFEVTEIDENRHVGTVSCSIENAEGKECISGFAKLMNPESF